MGLEDVKLKDKRRFQFRYQLWDKKGKDSVHQQIEGETDSYSGMRAVLFTFLEQMYYRFKEEKEKENG